MKVQHIIEHFYALPIASFNKIAPGTSLILAPHSDDESLGCAGLIATAVQHGRSPVVLIVSDGSASHPGSHAWSPERLALCRQEESRNAATALGLPADRLLFLGLRDAAVPTAGTVFENSVQYLYFLINQHNCRNVFVPWRHDPHCDHVAVWSMGQRLKALQPELRILSYPVWGLTLPSEMDIEEALPTGWRLNIEGFLSYKRNAIQEYRSQRGLVVEDDPNGFVLPEHLLEKMLQPYEIFITS
ncbi:LmbE family protein [Acetobacter ascendens]|uniref:LmbE family protein n=1 Tax=Acetobacter ascendens TaxID=481146 RepID=A0A1D8QVP6_9PROT|nr:PIG-L family deacetylase [Acetobacter ascendens]AOW46374.1 LmbE family protein [Acetobacter ascendens]